MTKAEKGPKNITRLVTDLPDDKARAEALDEIRRSKGRQPSNWLEVLGPATGECTRMEVTTGAKVLQKAAGQ